MDKMSTTSHQLNDIFEKKVANKVKVYKQSGYYNV